MGRGSTRVAGPDGGGIARLLARLALLAVIGSLVALVLAVGEGGLLVLGAGLLGLVACAVGVWWFVAHRGAVRLLGALLAAAAPAGVVVLFTYKGLWLTAVLLCLCWAVALLCARAALRSARPEKSSRATPASPPVRPVLIMNPKSGGGKVGRFHLAERAEELGARVILLDPSAPADVAELAREAVAGGADLLGVAGGDGTQALVAAVAAEHDLPFLVVSAGTRNHFAMDLGLDRSDPSRCLDALTDGEELRIDLGDVAGRAFVNTVSFGVYADVVQHPEYRDDKTGTALALMPDLLLGDGVRRVDARVDDTTLSAQQALLISNNPYVSPDELSGSGRRPSLDDGELGVLGIRVEDAGQAADLAVRGSQSNGLTVMSAQRVEVTAGTDEIAVAVDGEALRMPTPVVCTLRAGALRVLVPRDRPGVPVPLPPVRWRQILDLALGRTGATG
ncbi:MULTISPECIES: diacylglycerol kinase family protein [unclassified Streptomyces]|uniref:diacylglycerol/lipid kinase family protein n=1 Tax=unclassified Streptomyces TaxID=2593676 RepID=UPI0006F2C13A|nr:MULTISPECIES: diacylglycerol kinase family protein [unclassified Streptomyces]KQX56928.1 diacylglycerol kinase [Streptomyces sp. Root1304]KRA98509.1 diacylglycerol kinase [Streptomyces sp. Root66D1]